jgi:hypothetical protein
MKKLIFTFLSFIMVIFMILGCSETMPLPDDGGNSGVINTDPNKFVRITPNWSLDSLDLNDPVDIFASKDGRLYLADPLENTIRVIRPSGEVETGIYDTLSDILINGNPINPTSVCLDARFNVYFANDGDVIYFWPQFAAMIGIKGIITHRQYRIGGVDSLMTPLDGLSLGLTAIPGTEVIDSTNTAAIDSLMNPRVFYDPQSTLNRIGIPGFYDGDPVYATQNKSFVGVAPAPTADLAIFAADAVTDNILKIALVPTVMVKLNNGQNIWQYVGMKESFIARPGTGAGTVADPISLSSDNAGNVYYAQTGDYFAVHKLSQSGYGSEYLVGIHDIMELNGYGYARDIAVADDNSIFVLDTLDRDVKMFSVDGEFIKSIMVREEWLKLSDSTYVGDSLVVSDTLVLQQYHDLLKNPMALTFYNEVLYTIDNGNNRILRFTKVDDVVIENPDREE